MNCEDLPEDEMIGGGSEPSPAPPEAAETPEHPVVIVDDDAVIRRVLSGILASEGLASVAFPSLAEARAHSREHGTPRLALIDWMLTDGSGTELCREWRQGPSGEQAYFIMVTGRDQAGDLAEAFQAGVDDFVQKPIRREELMARLRAGMRWARLHDRLASEVASLEAALAEVRHLRGLIPICMHCHRIRSDSDQWQGLESYIEAHSAAEFSHAVCESCLEQHYPETGAPMGDPAASPEPAFGADAGGERRGPPLVAGERVAIGADLRLQALLLGALSEGVLTASDDGRILDANAAAERTLELTRGHLLTRRLDELLCERSGPLELTSISSALARDGRWQRDLRARSASGAERVHQTVVVPFESAPGVTCWAIVLVEITGRLLLEQQLFQAQKLEAIGSLAAGVAHEINTPSQYVADNLVFLQDAFVELAGADGSAAGVETRAQLLAEVPGAIEQSLEGMDQIAKIVRSIKRFAHPGGGSRAPLELNGEIENAVTVSRNEWKYAAEVALDLAPELPLAACYPGEIGQVILNILVNAAHAIGKAGDRGGVPGHIRIASRRDGDHVLISIADDGSGIPEAVQPRIFDPFFTTKAVGVGTGQGLAICHRIVVEKHGGTLTFETRQGKGTTFFIRLPIEPPAARDSLAA